MINNQLTQIYNATLNGGVVIAGNALQVVGSKNESSLEFIKPDGSYTLDWRQNGSSAYLDIPAGSNVVYALLQWFGTMSNANSSLSIAEQYSLVNFQTPNASFNIGNENEVQYSSTNQIYSSKYKDVTSYVQVNGSGYYTLRGIPSVNPVANLDNNNKACWVLSVVYQLAKLPIRDISLYCGLKASDNTMSRVDKAITISGFKVPSPILNANLTMAIVGGDSNKKGGMSIYDNVNKINNDSFIYKLGNIISSTSKEIKTSPIFPYDNLFSGIIMNTSTESIQYGNIESRGTLGNKNNSMYNIKNQASFRGNRSKLDIISLDISNYIVGLQNNLILVPEQYSEDEVQLGITFALQVDKTEVGKSVINVTKFSDRKVVTVNDKVTFTITIINNSNNLIENLNLIDTLPTNSSFLSNSLTINGKNIFQTNFPYLGISLPALESKSAIIIEYSVVFYDLPTSNPVNINPRLNYDDLNGQNIINGTSQDLIVLNDPIQNSTLYTNKNVVIVGDTLQYTVILKNNGLVSISKLIVNDLIADGFEYVSNSLSINGINANLDTNTGIILKNIYPTDEYVIQFKLKNII